DRAWWALRVARTPVVDAAVPGRCAEARRAQPAGDAVPVPAQHATGTPRHWRDQQGRCGRALLTCLPIGPSRQLANDLLVLEVEVHPAGQAPWVGVGSSLRTSPLSPARMPPSRSWRSYPPLIWAIGG